MSNNTHFETRAIHLTEPPADQTGSVANAIYPSTTFKRELDGSYASGFVYTRDDNPNRQLLEQALAGLEKGSRAFAFASGMAAISAVLQTLQHGDHVILPDDAYYSVHAIAKEVFARIHVHMHIHIHFHIHIISFLLPSRPTSQWLSLPRSGQGPGRSSP